jgi:poly-gamma-glutamate capsule biosynthesis protein CapA/YwtB (metallophosphatase superfamily)
VTHPLILLGDLAPTDLASASLAATPDHWRDALVIANLETPLCASGLPACPKAGPTIRGTPSILQTFTAWRRLVLVHANNHAMDYGATGLRATQAATAAASIPLIGVGPNLAAAASAHLMTYHGLRITILSPASMHWSRVYTHA